MTLFEECVQPWLAFFEELKAVVCKKIMHLISKSWRTHKSDLTRNLVDKGLDKRDKYKKLWARNKLDHCLGRKSMQGKPKKWEVEDRKLAMEGVCNPRDKYPAGCPKSYLCARSYLVKSEGSAQIQWSKPAIETLSTQIFEKHETLQYSGITSVTDKDVLTEVLGTLEQACMVCQVTIVGSIGRTAPTCTERGSNQHMLIWMWKPSKNNLNMTCYQKLQKKS
jgi:hypothetical protein